MVLVDSSQGDQLAQFQAVLTPEEWQLYGPPVMTAISCFLKEPTSWGPTLPTFRWWC